MMNRRQMLTTLAGCSLAAAPLVTPVSFAAVPRAQGRLVVILLRGAMDGLGVVAPLGDPGFAALRPRPEGLIGLGDGAWALHRGLAPLLPLWQAGELAAVHAVSTPYRDRRSHFDGQDQLEAGSGPDQTARDGWLNRLVADLPGATAQTTYALGNDPLAIATGAQPVTRWTPEQDLALSPQALRLAQIVMADDPTMAEALAQAIALTDPAMSQATSSEDALRGMLSDARSGGQLGPVQRMAEFAAIRLREDARIACFSLTGWDSHAQQDRVLDRALAQLSTAILTLKTQLGPAWQDTVVACVTEFGRTARLNGNAGTDHGTGGAMLLAGGAVNGGQVFADWPGLTEADLYDRRDLMPTRDLRAHLGWLLHDLFGVGASRIATGIFPGLDLGPRPALIL